MPIISNRYQPGNNPLAISPGELRHAIEIQSPETGTPGAMGMSISPANWDLVCAQNAAIYTAGGRETSMASQIVSEVSHVVKIRWPGVTIKANYRVIFGDRTLTVKYVENVLERNRVLLLYCLEVDGGGE